MCRACFVRNRPPPASGRGSGWRCDQSHSSPGSSEERYSALPHGPRCGFPAVGSRHRLGPWPSGHTGPACPWGSCLAERLLHHYCAGCASVRCVPQPPVVKCSKGRLASFFCTREALLPLFGGGEPWGVIYTGRERGGDLIQIDDKWSFKPHQP